MRWPKRAILKNWDFAANMDDESFCGRFVEFADGMKRRISLSNMVILRGVLCNSIESEKGILMSTDYIVSIKKSFYLSLFEHKGVTWWRDIRLRRIFCAKTSSGYKSYFRLIDCSENMQRKINYLRYGR